MLRSLSLTAIFLCSAALTAQADPTAQQLAERLDFVRRPTQSFEVKMTVTELRNGKQEQQSALRVMARKHPDSLRFDAVALCLEPVADKGKSIFAAEKRSGSSIPKASTPPGFLQAISRANSSSRTRFPRASTRSTRQNSTERRPFRMRRTMTCSAFA